jgi:hypothetical protein
MMKFESHATSMHEALLLMQGKRKGTETLAKPLQFTKIQGHPSQTFLPIIRRRATRIIQPISGYFRLF